MLMSYSKEEVLQNFTMLCSIVRQSTSEDALKVDLGKINEIIDKKIPEFVKDNAPDDFYEVYTDFKAEYERFKDFILYDELIGKNIIALGGGFSSGKSSFLNTLMGRTVLPEDINPSTSVPTYIMRGKGHTVRGINVFDAKVSLEPRDIRKIAHGFGELEDDDNNKIATGTTLGHILESVFFATEFHTYNNVAFLDTPGYSKPDNKAYSAKTDEQIARGQLNSSNYILWFIQSDAGTITEEDVKFIKSLRNDIPLLIILNKADKKTLADIKAITEKIKVTLDLKGVRYIDVLSFSSRLDTVGDAELRQYIENDIKKIKQQLSAWDTGVYESNFARNFKVLFVKCKEFYEDKINEESRKLTRLNRSITPLSLEDIDTQLLEPLQLLIKEAQRKVEQLKQVKKKLQELQNEFFTEIKYIADNVGIAMPEPSEIDLLKDKAQDPLQLLEEYKKAKGIKTDESILQMLESSFYDITPVINTQPGGSEYHEELLRSLMELCTIQPEDIHIHDVYKTSEEFQKIMQR